MSEFDKILCGETHELKVLETHLSLVDNALLFGYTHFISSKATHKLLECEFECDIRIERDE